MTDPAQPASEKWIDVSAHTAALGLASYKLEELSRQLALAQTENAGHIRIEDELKSDLAQTQARCAELEKLSTDANIAYGSLWNDRNSLQEKQDILVEFIQKIHDQAHARWKKEARSILAILDL